MRLFSCQRPVFSVAVQVQQIALGTAGCAASLHAQGYDRLLLSVTGNPVPPPTGTKKRELHLEARPPGDPLPQTIDVFERFPFHGTLRHRSSKYRPQLIQFCLYGMHKEGQRRTLLARFILDVIEHFDALFEINANDQSSHQLTLKAKGGLYPNAQLVVWMDSLHFVRPNTESALHLRREELSSSGGREIEMIAMGTQTPVRRKRIRPSFTKIRCHEKEPSPVELLPPRKRVSLSVKVEIASPEDDANDDHDSNDNHKTDEPAVTSPTSPRRPGTQCRSSKCASYRELLTLRRENQWQRDLLQLLTKQNEQLVAFHRNAHAAATERARSKSEGSGLLSQLETNQESPEAQRAEQPGSTEDHSAPPAFDEISFDGLVHQIEQEFRLLLDSHNEHASSAPVAVLSAGE